jgi:hypothetical protein
MFVDEPGDVRDHPISPIRLGDNAGLNVNNQQSRVRPVLKRRHIAVLPLVHVHVHHEIDREAGFPLPVRGAPPTGNRTGPAPRGIRDNSSWTVGAVSAGRCGRR